MPQGLEQCICGVTEWVNEWYAKYFCAPGSLSERSQWTKESKTRSMQNQCWHDKAFWPLPGRCPDILVLGQQCHDDTHTLPSRGHSSTGGWVGVRATQVGHSPFPQHQVPDPTGTRSHHKPRACFMEGTGLANTSQTPFRVKNWMEILGHLSGTPRGA